MNTIEPDVKKPTPSEPPGSTASDRSETSFRIRSALSRVFTPRQWGLRARFVYTTGALLLAGALTTLLTTSHILHVSAEDAIREKLIDYKLLVDRQLKQTSLLMVKTTAGAAALAPTAEALADNDPENLQKVMLRMSDRMRISTGLTPTPLRFYDADDTPFAGILKHTSTGASPRQRDMLKAARNSLTSLVGTHITPEGLEIEAVTPVVAQGRYLGAVEASANFSQLFHTLDLPSGYGLAALPVLANGEPEPSQAGGADSSGSIIVDLGTTDTKGALAEFKRSGRYPVHIGSLYVHSMVLEDHSGARIGDLLLFYDGSRILQSSRDWMTFLFWMTTLGVAFLWISLYLNVKRIQDFLSRMKHILIASHSNNFNQRFESSPVHCLEVLNCGKKECPVHQDPSRVCYLETGDEAISPKWRNTCVFLKKYTTCRSCPVYTLHHGDELMEMRHVVNTSMRLWGSFLGDVGNLLTDVLHTDSGRMPTLDDISLYLEQMARLTTYSHDLQGVYDNEEVYRQMEWVFENHFALDSFGLMEVNASDNRMHPVINRLDLEQSHQDVFINCELCRAKRLAEPVMSVNNPVLCPNFGVDHATTLRCCLPMVMGGRVGAVFTFAVPRAAWSAARHDLPIIRKYLEETAPVLSSLRLLKVSKEQALRDPLTKCHNRRFMDEYLMQFESLHQRSPKQVGFIMADLDFFKMVNDEHGHLAGDMILQQVADILRNNIRKSDLLIRYGGEEFLIMLMEINNEGACLDVAEKLRKAVEQTPLKLPSGGAIKKTLSLGTAEFPGDAEQLYKTIKYADVALYKAKAEGRNRVVTFNQAMWTEAAY